MHPRRLYRPFLLVLASLVAATGLVALVPRADAATTDIKINEVESNGDTQDWIELTNTGTASVNIGGWILKDNVDTDALPIAAGTTLAPGAFAAFDTDLAANVGTSANFGLGGADSARVYLPDGTTLIDTYSWTAHATTTYGRCPDGTGSFVTTAAGTKAAANSCAAATSPVKINEVESDDGTPGDWVELLNTGATSVDVSGYVFRDNVDADTYAIPNGTTIAAGGYLVIDVAQFVFGLGASDSARLFLPGTTTNPVDTYTWTAQATTTYGRCANGTGSFTTTSSPTKGGPNACPGDLVAGPWPGGPDVTTVDSPSFMSLVTSNLSGLYYQGTGSSTPGTMWAVRNGTGTLFRLVRSGAAWTNAAGDWASGKVLHYADGTGDPDAEGVTFTDAGPAGGAFVSTERNNAANTISRPAILQFDPGAAGTTLNAVHDYNLTGDLPTLGPNLGLEGIAWVPDSYLVTSGFKDQRTGAAYSSSTYANHGNGLFFVGVEGNGMVYAYALDQTSNTYTRVASFASGFPSVMELTWEADTQKLWVECDDTCQGRSSRFAVNASGFFAPSPYVERPSGMPNYNNEGFTVTPNTECVGGLKPVYWADDNDDGGYSLRQGSLSCSTIPPAPTATAPVTTAPPTTVPVVAPADTSSPQAHVRGFKKGGSYPKKSPKARCDATDNSGQVTCALTKDRLRIGPSLVVVVVTATATDAAGNTDVARKAYLRPT